MRRQLVLLVCLCSTACAFAQTGPGREEGASRRVIEGVRAAAAPVIDGVLADPVWAAAARADGFYDNQTGTKVADQTIAYIAYDDRYLYVAFKCLDSEPDKVLGRETIRDSMYTNGGGGGEDTVEVTLDPFLTYRWEDQAHFGVNPLGTPSARISGGRGGAVEWKGDWTAAAKRLPDGWSCEMRIPWGILSYPRSQTPLSIGINFHRYQLRRKLGSDWSYLGPQHFGELAGTWNGVVVPANAFRPSLSLLPYVLPGFMDWRTTFRAGLDAKYTITPELTAIGTLNPDFGTIEGAVEGIQFSRSERYVPERRPFFLEGSDYFGAGEGYHIGRYFYSNHIHDFDFGSKVYGKVTPSDTLGFLNTVNVGQRADTIFRLRHDYSPTSSAGIFVSQLSAKDDSNTVAVLLQNARWGEMGIATEWATSSGSKAGGGAQTMDITYSGKNNFMSFKVYNVSPFFRDANGLIDYTDFKGFGFYNERSHEYRKGDLRLWYMELGSDYRWHRDGRPFLRGGNVFLWLETRSDWGLGVGFRHTDFDTQTDQTFHIGLNYGVTNRFRRLHFAYDRGIVGDKPYSFLGPEITLRVLKKLDIAYAGAIQNLNGHEKQHILTLNYELTPTRSFGGRLVSHNSNLNWYLSYRRSGEKGTQLYFILGDPNAEKFVKRLAMKVVYPL
ncbi:MAG TPA: carbohydrate binding family 9 domain-containing protein [Armatimonadota bacterium]|jgi:hypothetical protein